MSSKNANQIIIQDKKGTRVELELAARPALDVDGEAAMAKVQIVAKLEHESFNPGERPQEGINGAKDRLLVGEPIGTDPSDNSILGKLRVRLTKSFRKPVKIELLQEDEQVRGIRAMKGQKVYNVILYPIPEGTMAPMFDVAVKRELNNIKMEMQPSLAEWKR